jgi:hypothetical protein
MLMRSAAMLPGAGINSTVPEVYRRAVFHE